MKIEITKEKDNPLLSRKEVEIKIVATGPTPKLSEIKDTLAAQLKSNQSLIVLTGLKQNFGSSDITTVAKVYKDEESLKTYETIKETEEKKEEKPNVPDENGQIKVQSNATPAEKKEGAPAEEKKEEKPAEDTKEASAKEKKEEKPAENAKETPAEEKKEEKPAEEKKDGEN